MKKYSFKFYDKFGNFKGVYQNYSKSFIVSYIKAKIDAKKNKIEYDYINYSVFHVSKEDFVKWKNIDKK